MDFLKSGTNERMTSSESRIIERIEAFESWFIEKIESMDRRITIELGPLEPPMKRKNQPR
uniref:Uncharacterized protein n=1 Tax=Candidatus Kentrum sp. LFY TaxID=2126342 RepID=A0A450V2Q4_9GAMM|nr:MAG: hypothetical protein BECKLFY1418A_GA0070994_10933 [Candidatus Kentron sp. LFY]